MHTPVYVVRKCTTDRLNAELNDMTPDYFPGGVEVQQVTHVGGRDWVIIFKGYGTPEQSRDFIDVPVEGRQGKDRR